MRSEYRWTLFCQGSILIEKRRRWLVTDLQARRCQSDIVDSTGTSKEVYLGYCDKHQYCCSTLNNSITNVCFLSTIFLFDRTSVMIIHIQKRRRISLAHAFPSRPVSLSFSVIGIEWGKERLRDRSCSIVTIFQCMCLSGYAGGGMRK
jgi:hypothetical protein